MVRRELDSNTTTQSLASRPTIPTTPSTKYDVVTMIHTIREWSAAHLQRFFAMIHSALAKGGVVIMDMVDAHAVGSGYEALATAGPETGRTSLYFLVAASHEGYAHTADDLRGMLATAGFAYTEGKDGGYVAARK